MKNLIWPVARIDFSFWLKFLLTSSSFLPFFLSDLLPGKAATVGTDQATASTADLMLLPQLDSALSSQGLHPASEPEISNSVTPKNPAAEAKTEASALVNQQPFMVARVTSVSGLSDVRPTDWAFQALQSLVERYGVIAGYPDGTFRGSRAMTRYEFAAGLNAALDRVNELIEAGLGDKVSKQDLETFDRLQKEFAKELTTLRGRVDALEGRVTRLEMFQFSTTTKLNGQAIFAINTGGQLENRVPNPGGDDDPNTIFFGRVLLSLNTSFTGRDRLLTQLQAITTTPTQRASGSPGVALDAAGYLVDDASALFYALNRLGSGFQLNRLSYTFPVGNDLTVSVFPRGYASDYVDYLTYANKQFDNVDNFSTFSLTQNILLFAQDFVSSGAAAVWRPGQGAFTFRAVYAAQDATVPNPTGLTTLPTGLGSITDVYGNAGGRDRRGGLFGDPYLGILEAEYSPSRNFAVRAQYANGEVGGRKYSAVGANFEYRFLPKAAVFGRFGYSPDFFPLRFFGGEKPYFWQAGFAFPDLLVANDLIGISVAQPLIIGRTFAQPNVSGTQTNYELFYNYPISQNIRVTPLLQVIVDPLNNADRGAVFTGTVRTVFSF